MSGDLPPMKIVPAAYRRNDPDEEGNYGNYDVADRDADDLKIRYIVLHDTEIPYDAALALFSNPAAHASAHYVLRASDGEITQMVDPKDVAWHAGNWYFNSHSVGLEHEGVAIEGSRWFTDDYMRASACLVRALARRYHVPLDRAHILGHDDIPGLRPENQSEMHWDPGPFWNWSRYMELLAAPIEATAGPESPIVTINPDFEMNSRPVTYRQGNKPARSVPAPGSNFVYLHTEPDPAAPLLGDRALHGAGEPGTTLADDWGDKAAAGQQFYRAERRGEWDGIYYGGQLAWFHNPHGCYTAHSTGTVVTPREGARSISVYGAPYPERKAYGDRIEEFHAEPLQYCIPAGQLYVATELLESDLFWTASRESGALVKGRTAYYSIFFNRRMAFVRADEVRAVTP